MGGGGQNFDRCINYADVGIMYKVSAFVYRYSRTCVFCFSYLMVNELATKFIKLVVASRYILC